MADKPELHKKICGWLRQARLRAKQHNSKACLEPLDIYTIYNAYNYMCAYCGDPAGSPDLLFNLHAGAPLAPANVVPCCDTCRRNKRGKDVIYFHTMGYIAREALDGILNDAIKRTGADQVKVHINQLAQEKQ